MKTYVLDCTQHLPQPPDVVFPFFADAGNLDRITPPWLHFRILTPRPIAVQVGTVIDYRLRYRGVPVIWQTMIEDWSPGVRFVDRALRSPYAHWHHTHTFEPRGGGTLMRDVVRYALPLGPLGRAVHRLWVRRDVEAIFDYRRAAVESRLAEWLGACVTVGPAS